MTSMAHIAVMQNHEQLKRQQDRWRKSQLKRKRSENVKLPLEDSEE